jgi:hypothetical protein
VKSLLEIGHRLRQTTDEALETTFFFEQIETELCVTLSTLDSFESEGFERMPDLAIKFSVRPSAARSLSRFLRRGECREVRALLLRKEVIQPQVPLRLPCYDFIPITGHTLGTRGHFGYNRLS